MATISIDYDSKGDVQLILGKQSQDTIDQSVEPSAQSLKRKSSGLYNIGPIGLQIAEFRFRVSSPRLISSSIYFKTMLESSRFREGRELEERGMVEIELMDPEDDPNTMMIILGILHDDNSRVPKKVDWHTLEKIAILVDKFQWHTLVAPHATLWIEELKQSPGLPTKFDGDLLVSLYIVWLFGMKDHFKTLSRVAQQDARKSIDLTDQDIRLPTRVLEAINKQRNTGFENIEQAIEAFRLYVLGKTEQKKRGSPDKDRLGYMVYGSAVMFAKESELLEFAPADHDGNSIRLLRARVRLLLTLEAVPVGDMDMTITPQGTWDLKYKLDNAIKEMRIDDWGLDYEDFKPPQAREKPVVQ